MLNLVALPDCTADISPLAKALLEPNTVLWLAGLLLFVGIYLIASRSDRTAKLGLVLMHAGMMVGAIPLVTTLLAMASDCQNPEIMSNLHDIMPLVNWLTLGIEIVTTIGLAWAVVLYKRTAPSPLPT